MKTNILKSVFFIALSSVIFTSCVKDDSYNTPVLDQCTETKLVKNRDVSQISAGAIAALHTNIVNATSDIIEAYVVSSDIGGNFFKSISFQTLDGTRAFAIPVDATSTFINYEPGRKVLIKMDGLYTDVKYGSMRIGGLFANSTGGAEVGRLPLNDFTQSVQKSCTIVKEDVLVQHVTLSQALNDSYINKLIEIDNIEFEPNALTKTFYDINNDLGGATNYNLIDVQGNSIIFRTSSYANYSSKVLPSGSGKVRGVLTKYGTDYQFIARSEKDVNLTEARFTPLLNESFSSPSSFGTWSTFSVTGAEVWSYSATFGNPGGMAKMSGYNVTNKLNEDWLISPVQNLSTLATATLSFDNATKFAGAPIVTLISNNYPGTGSPTATGVTWTVLTATLGSSTPGYVYANSGPININAFTGTGNSSVYVAFKYTSTTSAASTWEIDNVKIIP